MSKKLDKDALKGPDAFVSTSDKIFNYIEHHFKTFVTIVVLIVIGAVIYEGVGYYNSAQEQKAAEALYAPEAELKKADSDLREERAKKIPVQIGDKKKPAKVEAPRPPDFEKDYAAIVNKIKAQIKAHANSKAALVSALNLSYFLSQQKQFPQALEVLEIPTYRPSTSELLGGFWLMHRGVTFLENNQIDQAITAYQTVLGSEGLKVFYPEAMLKLGVAYEIKGDANKARETYEKIGREFPETEASSTAQQYIRLLELNAVKKG